MLGCRFSFSCIRFRLVIWLKMFCCIFSPNRSRFHQFVMSYKLSIVDFLWLVVHFAHSYWVVYFRMLQYQCPRQKMWMSKLSIRRSKILSFLPFSFTLPSYSSKTKANLSSGICWITKTLNLYFYLCLFVLFVVVTMSSMSRFFKVESSKEDLK